MLVLLLVLLVMVRWGGVEGALSMVVVVVAPLHPWVLCNAGGDEVVLWLLSRDVCTPPQKKSGRFVEILTATCGVRGKPIVSNQTNIVESLFSRIDAGDGQRWLMPLRTSPDGSEVLVLPTCDSVLQPATAAAWTPIGPYLTQCDSGVYEFFVAQLDLVVELCLGRFQAAMIAAATHFPRDAVLLLLRQSSIISVRRCHAEFDAVRAHSCTEGRHTLHAPRTHTATA